ncbi:MAG: hypothetical protein HUU35_06315, partial [Armatimonadetes bacterium]|nr:hypothetical protein [Armatimonadota bacterium]
LLGADEPTTGLTLLPTAFAEPRLTARSRLAPAPGYESAWLSAGGGRVLLGYLRNVAGGVNPWNVRLRRPQPLVVSLERPAEGITEIWDLDTRRRVVRLSGAGALNHNLGETDHDYAVLFQRR